MSEEDGERNVTPRYLGLAPYLYYADAGQALDWLVRVFGFTERVRYVDSAGNVFQASVLAGDNEVQMAGVGADYWATKGVDGPVGQLNIIFVDDVDAQHARVQAALPDVEVSQPQDQPYGARVFTVEDVGGNSWTFWQHISDTVELPTGWREIRPE
ncbi:VOC family protein [Haloechinothrix halophila]|uniref:VOC family protein n=1 Tax=Haloechinothrix halophila TaxID=1069073 RepID=UPI000423D627|nr:VOC family protein [Haloechinothrix halophila]